MSIRKTKRAIVINESSLITENNRSGLLLPYNKPPKIKSDRYGLAES